MAPRRKERKAEWESLCRRGMRDAVIRIFSKDGAQGLTMERVAIEAGMAKGTLYRYYRNKKELLEAVKEESFRPMREELWGILDSTLPPREKVRQWVFRHIGFFDEHRDFFRVLLWDRQLAQTYMTRRQGSYYRSSHKRIARTLEEGVRSGVFRPMDTVKLAAMLIESDIVVIAQRLLEEAPGPLEEDAEMVLDVFLNGISARRACLKRRP